MRGDKDSGNEISSKSRKEAKFPNPIVIIQIMTFVTISFVTLVTGILGVECYYVFQIQIILVK